MSVSAFTHLHVHSQYSLLDGAIRLKDLFPKLGELGMNAVALTDHGNLYGSLDFYKKAKAAGVKPIFGCETYICPDRSDRQNRRNYHLILLARNQEGWHNLRYLNSMGFLEGFYYHPRIDKTILREHSAGLIGLSACLGGEVAETLLKNGYEQAKAVALEYQNIFEPGMFFLEVQPNGLEEQNQVNDAWRKMSKETNIPLAATGDCHYVNQSDARAHEILMAIQQGRDLNDGKRLRHKVASYYLKSPAEFSTFFHDLPEALENTVKIANLCNVELPMGKIMMPQYHVPSEYDASAYFRKIAEEGLQARFAEFRLIQKKFDPDQYRAQLEREVQVIIKMDFAEYFLIVWDFIRYAKQNRIPVGPGRGSGAGSLVAYSMQISDIDPLTYNLLFERFLNPERVSMPDFDIDFCMNRRDEVIQYVTQKYGKDRVGQIVTFGSLSAKSALKDVGRVMGLPFSELNDLTKNMPALIDGHPITLQWALENEPKLKQWMNEKPQYKEVIDIAQALEGLHRNVGMHAAGIVIANGPLWDYVPCSRGQNGEIVTQFAKDEVEEIGLVKFDFLGLKTLTVIDIATQMIQKANPNFDLRLIPLDDAATYKMLSDGDTVGAFQMESSGFTEMVKKLKPDCFEDIIAAGALYRPGPLEGGMVDDFINRKHGRTPIVYHHPAMESILKETYGVIVYQEQVMQISRALAGYSLGGADLLRRAMGKKKKEVMDKEKANFLKGAEHVGVQPKVAAEVFDLMAAFAGYGFNKSHSAAYAMLTYQTAYLKCHYPHEFMASLLTCDKDDIDKVVKNVVAAREIGVQVLPPSVNESGKDFTVVELTDKPGHKAIRFGLSAIKGVGEGAADSIIEQRQEKPYSSLLQCCTKVDLRKVTRKTLESLIKSGAFDGLVPSRAQALVVLDTVIERAQQAQREKSSGQTSLFSLMSSQSASEALAEPTYPSIDEFHAKEKLALEKETLGFYISGHPMDRYVPDLIRARATKLSQMDALAERSDITVAGVVCDWQERPLKTGTGRMAFFQLEDSFGSLEVVCFSKPFAAFEQILKLEEPLLIKGTFIREGDGEIRQNKLQLKEVFLLTEWRRESTKKIVIEFDPDELVTEKARMLYEILGRHKGTTPVVLSLRQSAQWTVNAPLSSTYCCKPTDGLLQDLEKLGAKIELK